MAKGKPTVSATGRNLEGNERHAFDFYETPGWCTRAIIPHLRSAGRFGPLSVLDAGAGTGAILRECMTAWPKALHFGVELDVNRARAANEYEPYPDVDAEVFQGAFEAFNGRHLITTPKWDLVISNPPYKHAEDFVCHALTIGRTCAFLLRLNWLASKSRAKFHRAHPSDVFVLPKRPSFTGDGKTDATEYAWFVWGPTDVEECLNGGFRGNRWQILDVNP